MKLAIIRMKGEIGLRKEIKDTFRMLNLPSKFSCSVIEDTPLNRGMVIKIKDFSTFGQIGDETLALLKKREEKGKKYYRLHPPLKGFERKGVKKTFREGGALGDRGDKMSELIKRMI